jgi:hypothetical protein
VTFGISDQKPEMFTDPLFTDLQIRHARLVVPWDVLRDDWQVRELDAWMAAARLAQVRPLLAFGRSRRDDRRDGLPTVNLLRHEFLALRARYPWATEWAAWNEANHCGQPTCRRPDRVADYFDMLRTTCPECTVLGAEVLDQPNMVAWVRAFKARAKAVPSTWGLHNYVDANRMRTSGTRALLANTGGEIWFTETGGIVWRRNRGKIPFPESPSHAATAIAWVFNRLVPLSPRITRVYLYHWSPGGPEQNWDSALTWPDGTPRPAYDVLRRTIRRAQDARAKAKRR